MNAVCKCRDIFEHRERNAALKCTAQGPAEDEQSIAQAVTARYPGTFGEHQLRADEAKVRAAIALFPAVFGLRAHPLDTFRISPAISYVSEGQAMLYTQRLNHADGTWLDFAKGSPSELRAQIIAAPQPATPPEPHRVVTHHLFGLADEKGRDVGVKITTWKETRWWVQQWATRDGREYGAIQRAKAFDTEGERDASAVVAVARARKRYTKKYGNGGAR